MVEVQTTLFYLGTWRRISRKIRKKHIKLLIVKEEASYNSKKKKKYAAIKFLSKLSKILSYKKICFM